MKILVAGGAGYIGSNVADILADNHDVVIVDKLPLGQWPDFGNDKIVKISQDLCDAEEVDKIFQRENFNAIIHLAGYKAVGESVQFPIMYYKNNIICSINLIESAIKYNVNNFVFSSSACVYKPAKDNEFSIAEDSPLGPINPYGQTKLQIEQILQDTVIANPDFHVVILRYFNPGGIGRNPALRPSPLIPQLNLLPILMDAIYTEKVMPVLGRDWETRDGTGIRDYIHIEDLSDSHVAALDYGNKTQGFHCFNVGTGKGSSVQEMIDAFEEASGKPVKSVDAPRRPGDLRCAVACVDKIKNLMNWSANKSIKDIAVSCCNDYTNINK